MQDDAAEPVGMRQLYLVDNPVDRVARTVEAPVSYTHLTLPTN